MNIKKACSQSTDTCEMTCQNPNGSGCLILGSYFSDGLSCGLAGTCQNGSCNEGSLSDKIGNWISKNKQYSIRALRWLPSAAALHLGLTTPSNSNYRGGIYHCTLHPLQYHKMLLLRRAETHQSRPQCSLRHWPPTALQSGTHGPSPPKPRLPACATASTPLDAATPTSTILARLGASPELPTWPRVWVLCSAAGSSPSKVAAAACAHRTPILSFSSWTFEVGLSCRPNVDCTCCTTHLDRLDSCVL